MKTLIIEDDAETATFIAAGLQSRGHEPRLAADGREGFELAAQETFDVIILDRMLPGLDGLSVVALLRGEGVSTSVLFLTNLSGVDDRVEGLGARAATIISSSRSPSRSCWLKPAIVVDLLDEAGKVFCDVLEGFEDHRVDRLDLQRLD